MWLRTVWLSSSPDSRSYASAKGLSLCAPTWQYRRNASNQHMSCNTQLLITWVHRPPRILYALWFSRKNVCSTFWLLNLWSFEIWLPSLTLPCSDLSALCFRRLILPGRVSGAHLPSCVNLYGADIGQILSCGTIKCTSDPSEWI